MRLSAMAAIVFLMSVTFLVCLFSRADTCHAFQPSSKFGTSQIPAPKSGPISGSEFLHRVAGLDEHQREQVILETLLQGHLPDFLRHFKPVRLTQTSDDGRTIQAVFFVTPDYLSIGTDEDFVRIPMNLRTAGRVALRFHCILPTATMVDAIYAQSDFHYHPQPMLPGPQMRSTACYLAHNRKIKAQRMAAGIAVDKLVSGHKKDVVITNRLLTKNDRIAIYGWHRHPGDPIQPLSTVHGAGYADYSHGIRLVSDTVLIDGKPYSLSEVLENPRLAPIFSSEGPIHHVHSMLSAPSSYYASVQSSRYGRYRTR